MKTYVFGDIHGQYKLLLQHLQSVDVKNDRIIFLGDYCDWGPQGIDVIKAIMSLQKKNPNVIAILGNHDLMMLEPYLDYKGEGFQLDGISPGEYALWVYDNGGLTTWEQLRELSTQEQIEIFNWVDTLPVHYEFEINGLKYTTAHAFPNKVSADSDFGDKYEAVWCRRGRYYQDIFDGYSKVFLGHNVSKNHTKDGISIDIRENIYHLDCGAKCINNPIFDISPLARLCMYCVDDNKAFYKDAHNLEDKLV